MLVYWPHYVSSCPEQVTLWSSVHLLRHISPTPDSGHTVKGFKSVREALFKLMSLVLSVHKHVAQNQIMTCCSHLEE